MTSVGRSRAAFGIIPYQELLGNYDKFSNNTSIVLLYHTKSY